MKKYSILILAAVAGGLVLFSCGDDTVQTDSQTDSGIEVPDEEEPDPFENKGIGPIDDVKLGELDPELAERGKVLYQEKCTSCHKPDEKFIGPAPTGILDRRSPEWIMNMILSPELMIKEDPIAKELFSEFATPMTNQQLTEEEARSILEYFRTL